MILNIKLHEAGSGQGDSIAVLTGRNRTGSYQFTSATVKRERLSFTTAPMEGFTYRFKVKFTRSGGFAKDEARRGKDVLEGVLEGTMKKVSSGRELSTMDIRFDFQTNE
ncbi:MAG: hypothetical protein ACJ754_06965 [Pyrinomonadaceae bacterium]